MGVGCLDTAGVPYLGQDLCLRAWRLARRRENGVPLFFLKGPAQTEGIGLLLAFVKASELFPQLPWFGGVLEFYDAPGVGTIGVCVES